MSDIAFSPPAERRHWFHAVTGVVEVCVLMAGSTAAALAARNLVSPDLMTALGLTGGQPRDFLAATASIGVQLLAQYAALLVLVAVVGWLRGRRKLRDYAVCAPKEGVGPGIVRGLVVGLIISIIPASVFVLQDIAPIGEDTPIWAVLRGAEGDWTFWVFTAVASFAFVPIVEEGAWRGYVMGRLGEGFAPGAAALLTTMLFAVLHVQYLRADAAMMLTFVGLILASLAFAFTALRSGSLLTAIVAHAVLNFPLPTYGNMAKVVLGVLALVVFHRAVGRELAFWCRSIWRVSSLAVIPALAALAGVVAVVVMIPNGALIAGGGVLALLVCLGFLRRSAYSGT